MAAIQVIQWKGRRRTASGQTENSRMTVLPLRGVNGKAPDRKFSDDNEPPEKPDDALVQGAGDAEKT